MAENYCKLGLESGASGDMFLGALFSCLEADSKLKRSDLSSTNLKNRLDKLAKCFGVEYSVNYSNVERLSKNALNLTLKKSGEKASSHHVTLATFKKILDNVQLLGIIDANDRQIADEIISILAEAEAKAHEVTLAKVHFHEIGEEDSIFDIIASAILISELRNQIGEIDFFYDRVEIGYGKVDTSHGLLDIPAPATKNIIDSCNLRFKHDFEAENLTPTGAAILGYLKPKNLDLLEGLQLRTIVSGVGGGSRNPFDRANILTLELLTSKSE